MFTVHNSSAAAAAVAVLFQLRLRFIALNINNVRNIASTENNRNQNQLIDNLF